MGQEDRLNITIDNKVYDLTDWQEYHPGGKYILEQYNEKDATEVFWSFHGKGGHEKLKLMNGVTLEDPITKNPKLDAFRKLRQNLKEQGFFEPNLYWQAYKCCTTVGLLAVGTIFTYFGYWIIGAILFGIGYQQLGWLGHDACHHGLTPYRKLNNFLGYFFGNVLNGFSVNWWKDRHNSHHAITNVLDADPDVDNLPLFVWSEYDLAKLPTESISTFIVPYQHWYFIPWTSSLKIIWSLQSIFYLMNTSVHNRSYLKSLTAERLTLLSHYILMYLVLRMTPSVISAVLFFFISQMIGGSFIALIVFMNHYACDQLTKSDGKDADFLKLQLQGTKNIDPGMFMDWFAGGLNYQVEHHLFPTIPRHNLHKVKPIIENFCKENELPYFSCSYSGCLITILQRLSHIAHIHSKQVDKQK